MCEFEPAAIAGSWAVEIAAVTSGAVDSAEFEQLEKRDVVERIVRIEAGRRDSTTLM